MVLKLLSILLLPCLVWAGGANYYLGSANTVSVVSSDPVDNFPSDLVYSVGITATELDNEGTIQVTDNIATFSAAFPTNVGVGDVVQYDVDNDSSIEAGEYGIIRGISSDRTKAYLLNKAGGNVTNTTVATELYDVFRAYTSLGNWEANTGNSSVAEPIAFELTDLDLTDSGDEAGSLFVALYNDGALAPVLINGFTTDSSNTITIFAPYLPTMVGTTQRHTGTSASGAVITSTDNWQKCFDIANNYVTVEGIRMNLSDFASYGVLVSGTNGFVDKCVIYNSSNSSSKGFWVTGGAMIQNSLIYDVNGPGVEFQTFTVCSATHVTIHSCRIGVYRNAGAGTHEVKYSIVSTTTDDFSGTMVIDYCASDDGDGTNAVQPADWTGVFTNSGTGDCHLKSTDSYCRDAATGSAATKDIDNEDRPYNSISDIGYDEYR